MPDYDLVIIGSGPAGYSAAFTAVKYKLKVAIAERDPERLGGVCLGEGCIPLKGLLYHARHGGDYNTVRDLVMERVAVIRSGLRSRITGLGIDIIPGEARFLSADEVSVNGKAITARFFIIASGSSPKRIFDRPNVNSSEKIFSMDRAPGRALIIGGGVVGCEYASFLSAVGSSVDIVEAMDSLLPGEDAEAVRVLTREFKKKGINTYASSAVAEVGEDNTALIKKEKQEKREKYDIIFETIGRRPVTAGLDLERAGVRTTDRDFIEVNTSMQTTTENIYAAGDCIDTPMLAYTASREAETAVRHLAGEKPGPVDYGSMPRLVFSVPQVGSVGIIDEKGADAAPRHVYRYFFRALGKAVMEGKETGFVKLIANENEEIIGASAVGEDIADIMNQLAMIAANRIPVEKIRQGMFVHPSYSEIILDALQYGG